MLLNKKLDLLALRRAGIDLFHTHEIGFFGDVEIEAPTFCASQIRYDTFIRVGAFGSINGGTEIGHTSIGRYCSIAQGSYIGGDRHPLDWVSTSRMFYVDNFRNFGRIFNEAKLRTKKFESTGPLTFIGNDVLIAYGCIINRGVVIGDGAIVTAGSVVTKDVPPYAVVGGCPAKVIKYRFPDNVIEKLLALRWWDYNMLDFPDLSFSDPQKFIEEFSETKSDAKVYCGLRLGRDTVEKFTQ